jgi:citrate lyase subunit beta/citryl-CoA lyase
VPGADSAKLQAAAALGADVIIQELEDFTLPQRRPEARASSAESFRLWRESGALAAIRVNPLATDGIADLEAAMCGRPDIVMLPKVVSPGEIAALDRAITRLERETGIAMGATEIVPNVETAAGLVATGAIAVASARISCVLVGTEDMAADLGAERSTEGSELAYARSRFLVECVAAGVTPIDCPYTFADLAGAEMDTLFARRLGYKAKSIVNAEHVALVNRLLTPQAAEIERAKAITAAFRAARERGEERVDVAGLVIEVPSYLAALRLLDRARQLADCEPANPAAK